MKKQFTVNQNGVVAFRKRLLLILIPGFLLVVLGGFAIIQYTVDRPLSSKSLFFAISLVLGSMAFTFIRKFKPTLKLFSSYTITLDEETISRTRDNTPTIQIPLNEITQIIQTKYKNIIIKGENLQFCPTLFHKMHSLVKAFKVKLNLLHLVSPFSFSGIKILKGV